jgi:hypothetical protein
MSSVKKNIGAGVLNAATAGAQDHYTRRTSSLHWSLRRCLLRLERGGAGYQMIVFEENPNNKLGAFLLLYVHLFAI